MSRRLALVLRQATCAGCLLCVASTAFPQAPPGSPRLVIAPLIDVKVKNGDDVADDLGKGDPSQVFAKFLHASLPDLLVNAAGGSLGAVASEAVYSSGFVSEERELRRTRGRFTRDTRVRMRLPKNGTTVAFRAVSADLVLFFEDFDVRRKRSPGVGDGPEGVALAYDSEFAIWDNRRQRVSCFGHAEVEDEVSFKMRRETWEKAMKKLAESIVNECPFAP